MNLNTIQCISQFRGLSQSELAKHAGISRQAVSKWFAKGAGFTPIGTDHLRSLSHALNVSADVLLEEIADPNWWKNETTNLLWDKLFDNLASFLAALENQDKRAMARLVEVYGMFASAKIVGKSIWQAFPNYKVYLPPVRRKELEQLWNTQKNLRLI